MARAEMRSGARTGEQPAPSKGENTYDDPSTQFEVLNPNTIAFDLELRHEIVLEKIENGVRTREPAVQVERKRIIIPTEFTLGDILKRRIYEDIEAWVQLLFASLRRVLPAGAQMSDLGGEHLPYLEAIMRRSEMRAELRGLIVKVATYESDPAKPDERRAPTLQEITDGLSFQNLMTIGFVLIGALNTERQRSSPPAGAAQA